MPKLHSDLKDYFTVEKGTNVKIKNIQYQLLHSFFVLNGIFYEPTPSMGISRGGQWIFTHDTANVFLTSTRIVKTIQLSLTIVLLCCAG